MPETTARQYVNQWELWTTEAEKWREVEQRFKERGASLAAELAAREARAYEDMARNALKEGSRVGA